ncbi:hypothetical protein CK203_057635 [Vitis vinifera]|uniref:Uncharacterized protein n=1 Tax=Vitis vinifera TaxID=29760 RepID=A0A438GNH3_VITVI|nr:hypothetical protein CK203_057635 [Vitis vinifera]
MSRIKWRRCREGATSTVKQPLRVTCDLHHKFDQSSHYDHEKDKFAYLSMRDRIELGKRQVQQSQWGSKYALNGDDSYEHTVGECPTIPTMRDMYGYQSSYTSSWNNHPNLTTQPQPQPSMSTSSLEQAILKISKVMEDFVGEQQKINSHLNEKIDNMESSINVRMEGVYNDLSLRIEKVQDSIEKLTNLDIARGKMKLPPQPHHNLQGTNAKRSRKVLKIDTLVGDCYDNSMDQPSIENHKDANFVWDPGGIQHEVGVYDACKNRSYGENKGKQGRKAKQSNSHHPILATVGNISITSRSSFHAYYISFRSLGSQDSNASNGVQIGVETKKLWSFQENWTELSGNFAHLNPRCENLSSRCINFAHHNSRCEIHSNVRIRVRNFATVGHNFEALPGAQIMHMICRFKAWEVKNPELQTVCDLDLKRRSYDHLKTTMQS